MGFARRPPEAEFRIAFWRPAATLLWVLHVYVSVLLLLLLLLLFDIVVLLLL